VRGRYRVGRRSRVEMSCNVIRRIHVYNNNIIAIITIVIILHNCCYCDGDDDDDDDDDDNDDDDDAGVPISPINSLRRGGSRYIVRLKNNNNNTITHARRI